MLKLTVLAIALLVLAAASVISGMPIRERKLRPLSRFRGLRGADPSANDTARRYFDAHGKSVRGTALRADTVTTSGISAGAVMGTQFQYAHSSMVQANAVIAGVPYYCSQGLMAYALTECMDYPELINLPELDAIIATWAASGQIDNIDNLQNQYTIMWSGTDDTVVAPGSMQKLAAQYSTMLVGAMETIFNYSSEHAWISSNRAANPCSYLGSPYVNNCDNYDFAGEYLRRAFHWMAGPQRNIPGVRWNSTRGAYHSSHMVEFSQSNYGASSSNSMDSVGYLYVPSRCGTPVPVGSGAHSIELRNATAKCHVHMNWHGCLQERSVVGDSYVSITGLNEWAESNDIVIVYPQAAASLLNPKGCFEWWAFDGMGYKFATKNGAQITMFHAMLTSLIEFGKI
jgi:hypothetical protein